MADAELERTTISVGIGGKKEKFVATGEVITFDGFLQVYRESFDDENEKEQENGLLPPVTLNEVLSMKDIVLPNVSRNVLPAIRKQVWFAVWRNWESVVLLPMRLRSRRSRIGSMS